MYSYSYYEPEPSFGFNLFFLLLLILVLAGWIIAINLLIKSAQQKGHYLNGGTGVLWFVGVCASPMVLGLYVISLCDKRGDLDLPVNSQSTVTSSDLPEL